MRRLLTLLPLLLALALFIPACGDDDDDTAATDGEDTTVVTEPETTEEAEPESNAPAPSGEAVRSAKVEMVDFSFEPPTVTVQAGGKVIWQNEGDAPHTATADDDSFDTGTVEPGKLKSENFKTVGTYSYICTIHPDMKGTVEVVE